MCIRDRTEAVALYLQKYIVYRKRKISFADGSFTSFIELIIKHKDEKFLLALSEPHKPCLLYTSYRAVTLYALEHGAIRSGIVDEDAVVGLLDQITITFRFNPERGASDIYVNGDLAEGKIRTIEVSNCVSQVSAIPAVRRKLVAMQQEMGRRRGVVMDGRAIGTVVFPDAELKIFMTADRCV